MADSTTRIKDLDATTTLENDDWLAVDGVTEGTRKIRNTVLKEIMQDGSVMDVTVNGTSVVTDGTASITVPTDLADLQDDSTHRVVTDTEKSTWSGKQDALTFDDVPTDNSNNPVKSNGIYDALATKANSADLATVATSGDADDVTYDNTTSGLAATNVQAAIDEVLEEGGKVQDVKVDGTSVVDNNKVAQIDLTGKADVDGIYDELVAGNVMSDSYESDTSPYLYRASHSGSAVEEEIVGGSIAWNQQFSLNNLPSDSALYSNNSYTANGVTFTKNSDGSITIQTESGGATERTSVKIGNNYTLPFIQQHIHLIGECKGGSTSTYFFNYASSRNVGNTPKVFSAQASGFNMWLIVESGTVISTPTKVCPQIMDLEQCFGSAIANNVYNLEQSTAGSGIAWLKSYGFLSKDYYAYNAGGLESVNVASRKVVGKNLCPTQASAWEQGSIQPATGEGTTSTTRLRTIDYYPIKNNTDYYITARGGYCFLNILFYDANKNYIGDYYSVNALINGATGLTINIPSGSVPNVAYYKTTIRNVDNTSTVVASNIEDAKPQIELGTTATAYEPYTSTTYDLSGQHEVKRKFGVVDLGSLEWSYNSSRALFVALISDGKASGINTGNGGGITAKYTTVLKTYGDMVSGEMSFGSNYSSSSTCALLIKDSSYSDATTFKQAMNGVYLVYELATPTTETVSNPELRGVLKLDANNNLYYYGDTMSDIPNPQLVYSVGTEEYIDAGVEAGTRDVAIPVGHESKYYLDIKGKVEQLYGIPEVPSTNGTYTLKATRSNSGVAYSWVSG